MGITEKVIIEQKKPSQCLAFNNSNMQTSICRVQLTDLQDSGMQTLFILLFINVWLWCTILVLWDRQHMIYYHYDQF